MATFLTSGYTPSVAFSLNGRILASGDFWDNNIHLWDMADKKEVAVFKMHKDTVSSLDFSPDGKWLASGSYDGTILLWEVNLPVSQSVEPSGKQLGTWGEIKHTKLYQNYPNPFNPETWIPYQLAEPAEVTIYIHTQSGQVVREIRLGYKTAGTYLEKSLAGYWDSKNESGENAASGVYFYRLNAGDFCQTCKMTVLK